MTLRRWALLGAPIFLLSSYALAAPSAADKAAAQGLFDQAKEALSKSDWARACPMLEESQRLDPAEGTQFYLAKCYEGMGRVASAWTLYIDVSDAAKLAGNADRQKIARQHADDIAKRVPRLVLAVPPGVTDVTRDGEAVGRGQWATPIPVDPGTHKVTASAAGKQTFEGSIAVAEGQTATLTIPPLADVPAASTSSHSGTVAPPPASASSAPSASSGLGTQKILALTAGGVGLAGVVLGAVFGLTSKAKHDDAAPDCQGNSCTGDGVSLRSDAIHAGNLSTAFFAVGVAGLAGGAALWLTAPSSGAQTGVAPAVGPHLAGVRLGGSF